MGGQRLYAFAAFILTAGALGVALFGSLFGESSDFVAGAHAPLVISALVLLGAAAATWQARANQTSR